MVLASYLQFPPSPHRVNTLGVGICRVGLEDDVAPAFQPEPCRLTETGCVPASAHVLEEPKSEQGLAYPRSRIGRLSASLADGEGRIGTENTSK